MPVEGEMPQTAVPEERSRLPRHDRWERLGLALPSRQRAVLVRGWLHARIIASLVFVLTSLVLGLLWGWQAGFVVSALASLSMADAALRLRDPDPDPTVSIFIDITVAFVGLAVADVPDSAIGIPFLYLVLSAMLLLNTRRAISATAFASVWFVIAVRGWLSPEVLTDEVRAIVVAVVADFVFAAGFIGLLAVMIRITNRDGIRRMHDMRMQRAIAQASRVLLSGRGEDPLREAIAAFAEATDANAVFLEMNVDHPDLGLCSSLLVEETGDDHEPDPEDLWQLVPWSSMTGREKLERGESHTILVSELEGTEAEIYSQSTTRSELDIPIFVDGRWWGILGFTDVYEERPWARRDEALLFTAAEMIGAYLERAEGRDRVQRALTDLDRQVTYHQALAICAEALQMREAGALDKALTALLDATEADYAFIDENYEDPVAGLSTRVIHDVEQAGTGQISGDRPWMAGPFSELPTSRRDLEAGRPSLIITSHLKGREREVYEADGLLSELCLPITVGSEWRGSIGFADYQTERVWSDHEVDILQTAARMIGTYWEREDADGARERMLAAQDKRLRFETVIAECSRLLLMSGDSSAIEAAIEHLMHVTGTHDVFVDRNIEDPEIGLVAEVAHEVIRPGYEDMVDAEIWVDDQTGERRHARVAYSSLPTLRRSLEAGRPFIVIPHELPAAERQIYVEDGCRSELNIPIFSRGRWLGAIGFADYIEARVWDAEDVTLLQTVAEMIGSFWERNEAREQLEELVRSKDEFVAAVSHELRTPLTSVVGLSSELAERGAAIDEAETEELLSIIADQSAEVAEIVDDLLVAARADIGTLVVDPKPVRIADALDSLEKAGGFEMFDHIDFDLADVEVLADPTRLRQILRNLVVNASRYGGERLSLRVVRSGATASVIVADDGAGVDEALADVIFEPYGRAHEASTQPASVGLGLAVSRNLARLMGGDVTYTRADGWTEFTLTLPMATGGDAGHEIPVARVSSHEKDVQESDPDLARTEAQPSLST